jgi:hypothetical protein
VDAQDKTSGATEMQKHPNDLRPKRVMFRKQNTVRQIVGQTHELEVMK